MAIFVKIKNFMTKLSGKKSKKMIYFKIYRSKIHFTPNFMLIPMHIKPFFISTIIFKSNGNGNNNSNGNSNSNGNVYLNLAFFSPEQ